MSAKVRTVQGCRVIDRPTCRQSSQRTIAPLAPVSLAGFNLHRWQDGVIRLEIGYANLGGLQAQHVDSTWVAALRNPAATVKSMQKLLGLSRRKWMMTRRGPQPSGLQPSGLRVCQQAPQLINTTCRASLSTNAIPTISPLFEGNQH
jgi:hypothetical protein